MRSASAEVAADELRAVFVEVALGLGGRLTFADVGCGSGPVVQRLRDAGHTALGFEPDAAACGRAVAAGLPCVRAAATELPLPARSVDWVCMRHVPHHLDDLDGALAEAARVARRGLLLAEPWFDPALPGQQNALDVDLWLKRQHRRLGIVHHPVRPAAELLAALRVAPADVTVRTHLTLRQRPLEPLRDEAAPLLAGLAADAADRRAWQTLWTRCAQDGVTWNGTQITAVRLPPHP